MNRGASVIAALIAMGCATPRAVSTPPPASPTASNAGPVLAPEHLDRRESAAFVVIRAWLDELRPMRVSGSAAGLGRFCVSTDGSAHFDVGRVLAAIREHDPAVRDGLGCVERDKDLVAADGPERAAALKLKDVDIEHEYPQVTTSDRRYISPGGDPCGCETTWFLEEIAGAWRVKESMTAGCF